MGGIKYQAKLDGLRCIAISMVLIEHFAYFIGGQISAGYYGVNLFFVLSGFLITSILISDSTDTFKKAYLKFLGRRSLRIFPVYFMAILIFIIINAPHVISDLPYLLSYTFNYHIENVNVSGWDREYSHFWSLSVEEQFYLFFPIIVLLLKQQLNILKAICFVFLLTAYFQIFFNIFSLEKYNYTGLLTNMAPLSVGAIGAIYIKQGLKSNWVFKNIYFEIIVFIALCIVIIFTPWTVRMLLCPVLNLFLIMKAYSFNFSIPMVEKFLTKKAIVYTGQISYGIYIYHGFIGKYVTTYVFDPIWLSIPFENFSLMSKLEYHDWVIKLPVYTLLSIGVAALSYQYFEKPILKLKDRFFNNTGMAIVQ